MIFMPPRWSTYYAGRYCFFAITIRFSLPLADYYAIFSLFCFTLALISFSSSLFSLMHYAFR